MSKQYKQLTLIERCQIEALIKLRISARKIALRLRRSNKSISSELLRCPETSYCAESAHSQALDKRRQSAKFSKRNATEVKEIVNSLLALGLSPEQIAGRMKKENFSAGISCSSIYNLVKAERWQRYLARKGKRYRQRKGIEAGARLIPGRVDISNRPCIVDDNTEIGHWEGDTVYGQDGYLVTLVERVSKLLVTCRVKKKSKIEVTLAIKKLLKPFRSICKSITFDNGGEFAGHKKVAKALNCDIYFARPYHSWERGLNENTNGLLRRFFPKGMKIGSLLNKQFKQVQYLINMRPRKALNYLSPYEFLTGERVSLIVTI